MRRSSLVLLVLAAACGGKVSPLPTVAIDGGTCAGARCVPDAEAMMPPKGADSGTVFPDSGIIILPKEAGPPPPDTGVLCVPNDCIEMGIECGAASDGCGNVIECGACNAPDTCGGGSLPGVCGSSTCTACVDEGTWTGTWQSMGALTGPLTITLTGSGMTLSGTAAFANEPCLQMATMTASDSGGVLMGSIMDATTVGMIDAVIMGNSMTGKVVVTGGMCVGDTGTFTATR